MARMRAFLLIACILAGGILLYTRGGGGGIDPKPGIGQLVPSIPKPAALPKMCTVEQKIDPLQKPSQIDKQRTSTCVVEFPATLQVNAYCLNKPNKLGGATVILSQGTSEFINLTKNCDVVLDEDGLYAKKIACFGLAGSKVNLTVQNSCTPPDANLPEFVKPYCPSDYSIKEWDSRCQYTPPANSPACPVGYHFDSSANCCSQNDAGFPFLPACPHGYEPATVGWKPGVEESTYVPDISCIRASSFDSHTETRPYSIVLGSCSTSNQNNDENPVPCTIDPATGACK